jgi:nucleotide-binding universal stress UspA family protein
MFEYQFTELPKQVKQEIGELAKLIEEEGGTAVTIQLLDDYKSQAKNSGIKQVNTIRREGNAATEILHIADEENVDTIVVGSTGVNTVKEFLLGGVPHKVIYHAKCPVTIVRRYIKTISRKFFMDFCLSYDNEIVNDIQNVRN